MAEEADEAAARAPALERTAPVGSSSHRAAQPDGRVFPGEKLGTRKQRELAQQCAAEPDPSDSETGSELESDFESLHSDDRREHTEEVESHSGESSQKSPGAVLDGEGPLQDALPARGAEHSEPVTAASMTPRASKMFIVGAAEVAASGPSSPP